MALGVTDLKKGTIIKLEGVPYRITEYSQKVMGRGGSIVNVKIKSLTDGRVLEKTFKGNDSIDSADVAYSSVQYLYSDNEKAYFMDGQTYETKELPIDMLGDQTGYLIEGLDVQAQYFDGNIIGVELPKNVFLKVTHAENAVKGDTSSAVTKDAKLETGISVKVPAFIKTGDVISVDTTTGNYRERKK
ncbi:elongation factor P [Candidatus Saccharibacteria bacterium]|nr:elongation factor P [Candidatus Saccharibacteria bacterium]